MILTATAPAALNPVPIREFAAHLRLAEGFADDTPEDALLDLYLRNATAAVETRLAQTLIRRSFTLELGAWNRNGQLVLPVGPVAAIDSLRFLGADGPIEGDPTGIQVEPGRSRQRLSGAGGACLPAIPKGHTAELGFQAGYGESWNAVPDDLRQSVLLLAAHYFENRHAEADQAAGIPYGVLALLEPHRPARL